MGKKVLIFGFIVIVIVVGLYSALNSSNLCYDGQGSTYYVSKTDLQDNLDRIGSLESSPLYFSHYIDNLSVGFVARTSTDRCGKVQTRVVLENGREVKKSQEKFDEWIKNYGAQCENCLFVVSQSGNSPVFYREYATGTLYSAIISNDSVELKLIEPLD